MKDEFEGLSLDSLRECFDLIGSPPDEELLRKYITDKLWPRASRNLTAREREWIEVNLRCNPVWQEAYRTVSLEYRTAEAGRTVRRLSHRLLPIAVAAAILIAAPLWIDSLYVSRGLSSEGLQDALAIRDEVFRGSYSEPFQLPPSSERVLPPLLSSLVDVKLFRSDTTNLSLLKKDLIEEYNSAKDEFDRARAARSLTRLSLIDMDYEGAEYWRKKCEDEGIGECR